MKTYKEWLKETQFDPENVLDDVEQRWLDRQNKGSDSSMSSIHNPLTKRPTSGVKKSTDIGGPESSTIKNKQKPINFGTQTTFIYKSDSNLQ